MMINKIRKVAPMTKKCKKFNVYLQNKINRVHKNNKMYCFKIKICKLLRIQIFIQKNLKTNKIWILINSLKKMNRM